MFFSEESAEQHSLDNILNALRQNTYALYDLVYGKPQSEAIRESLERTRKSREECYRLIESYYAEAERAKKYRKILEDRGIMRADETLDEFLARTRASDSDALEDRS